MEPDFRLPRPYTLSGKNQPDIYWSEESYQLQPHLNQDNGHLNRPGYNYDRPGQGLRYMQPVYGQEKSIPGYVPGMPMYQPNPVVLDQPPQSTVIVTRVKKPPSCMFLAVIVCLFCNLPMGVVAIIFSYMSDDDYYNGFVEEARRKGRISMWISMSAVVVSAVAIALLVILLFTGVLNRNYVG